MLALSFFATSDAAALADVRQRETGRSSERVSITASEETGTLVDIQAIWPTATEAQESQLARQWGWVRARIEPASRLHPILLGPGRVTLHLRSLPDRLPRQQMMFWVDVKRDGITEQTLHVLGSIDVEANVLRATRAIQTGESIGQDNVEVARVTGLDPERVLVANRCPAGTLVAADTIAAGTVLGVRQVRANVAIEPGARVPVRLNSGPINVEVRATLLDSPLAKLAVRVRRPQGDILVAELARDGSAYEIVPAEVTP